MSRFAPMGHMNDREREAKHLALIRESLTSEREKPNFEVLSIIAYARGLGVPGKPRQDLIITLRNTWRRYKAGKSLKPV